MIALAEAEDLHEVIRNVARDEGRDMTDMHAMADEILSMEVGDSTPAPGALKAMVVEPIVEPLVVFAPPQHEGWNMPPDGKFYMPGATTTLPRQVRRLKRHVRRLTYWVAGLTMCFISAISVIAYRWNG